MKKSEIPTRDLYVALLDDDPDCSCRIPHVISFHQDFGQPLSENIFISDDINKFIKFADAHRDAILISDPGGLGPSLEHGVKFKADQRMYRWLQDNPSRILHVPYLMPIHYYSFDTFELKHQCHFFGSEFGWHINQILYEALYENNPLALFCDEFAMDCAHDAYIKKLKEPVLTEVCKKLGIQVKKISEKKKAIEDYYHEIWGQAMKRRGVKAY